MKDDIQPLGDRVLIRKEEAVKMTMSGIDISAATVEEPNEGEVIAVSSSVDERGDIEVGDMVIIPKFAGIEVLVDGVKHYIFETADIYGRRRKSD